MREHVFYFDARPVTISNANELESKCKEAAQLVATGQKVMVTLTGTWNLNAGQLAPFRLLSHATITVTMDKHPTSSYELNSVYEMDDREQDKPKERNYVQGREYNAGERHDAVAVACCERGQGELTQCTVCL